MALKTRKVDISSDGMVVATVDAPQGNTLEQLVAEYGAETVAAVCERQLTADVGNKARAAATNDVNHLLKRAARKDPKIAEALKAAGVL